MGSKREYLRVRIESPCLINYRDTIYRAILGNVSVSGALIRIDHDDLSLVNSGDSVGLMLCNNPNLCPTKYSCEVVWNDSLNMGVKFQNM